MIAQIVILFIASVFQAKAVPFKKESQVHTKNDSCTVNNCALSLATSGNPLFPGWYADPEAHVYGDDYWVYPTYSAGYEQQTFLDAFSSPDLVHWTKHASVLSNVDVSWAKRAVWAPSIVKQDDKYYLFFGANDIQSDNELGGIGVAVSSDPAGPFVDLIGRPLIGTYQNGAQPIDQMVFQDTDGQYYMYYGGHGHCNVVKLDPSMTRLQPFSDGTTYKEITPSGYVEGAFMLKRNGKYYFMWSEGGWTGPDYSVAYAIGDTPTGPFTRIGKILQQDPNVANGAGHHSVIKAPGAENWYIVYHRRPLDQTDGNSREVSIENLVFNDDGTIKPVILTTTGVTEWAAPYGTLVGEYYNGMNFQEAVFTRVDGELNFDWGTGSPGPGVQSDAFSVRWRGKIVPTRSDTYTFHLTTDNGRRMWVNGQLVVDDWVDDWNVEYDVDITLEAGQAYNIRIEYFENWGGALARLEWSSPNLERQVVPFTQ